MDYQWPKNLKKNLKSKTENAKKMGPTPITIVLKQKSKSEKSAKYFYQNLVVLKGLNTIDIFISRVVMDSHISHNELASLNNMFTEYDDMK